MFQMVQSHQMSGLPVQLDGFLVDQLMILWQRMGLVIQIQSEATGMHEEDECTHLIEVWRSARKMECMLNLGPKLG
jgi:hypothetical protein